MRATSALCSAAVLAAAAALVACSSGSSTPISAITPCAIPSANVVPLGFAMVAPASGATAVPVTLNAVSFLITGGAPVVLGATLTTGSGSNVGVVPLPSPAVPTPAPTSTASGAPTPSPVPSGLYISANPTKLASSTTYTLHVNAANTQGCNTTGADYAIGSFTTGP